MHLPSRMNIIQSWRHRGSKQRRVLINIPSLMMLCCLFLVSCSVFPEAPPPPSTAGVTPTVSRPTPTPGITPTPTAVTGCGKTSPVKAGTTVEQKIKVSTKATRDNIERTYRIHVPANTNTEKPLPLIFVFHGYSGSAAQMERLTRLSPLADQQGFLVVYAQGLPDRRNNNRWADIGPIEQNVDDALFVKDMLTYFQTAYCVDSKRVYATGFSNGGALTAYLACKMTDSIASFATVGAPYYNIPGGCTPGRGVSILNFHGTGDLTVRYNEGFVPRGPHSPLYQSVPTQEWLTQWATRNGCTDGPTAFLQRPTVVGEQWNGCRENANFVHYRLIGFGHTWPFGNVDGRSGNQILWEFFNEHPLPTQT